MPESYVTPCVASAAAERRAFRPALGLLALRMVKQRLYERLGFRSLGDYARERLGVTATVVREWARLAVAHAFHETDEEFVTAQHGRWSAAPELIAAAAAANGMPRHREFRQSGAPQPAALDRGSCAR